MQSHRRRKRLVGGKGVGVKPVILRCDRERGDSETDNRGRSNLQELLSLFGGQANDDQ